VAGEEVAVEASVREAAALAWATAAARATIAEGLYLEETAARVLAGMQAPALARAETEPARVDVAVRVPLRGFLL
jgi:hypothetical protein